MTMSRFMPLAPRRGFLWLGDATPRLESSIPHVADTNFRPHGSPPPPAPPAKARLKRRDSGITPPAPQRIYRFHRAAKDGWRAPGHAARERNRYQTQPE